MAGTAPQIRPKEGEEVWEVTTAGRIWLQQTTYTRTGQPIFKDISVGPNKAGSFLRISTDDRRYNQEQCADTENDMFRNGLLVRVDQPQSADPDTASDEALTTQDLLSIYAKNGKQFEVAVAKLGELPIRRLREMAEAVDATAKQVEHLDEVIFDRYKIGASQEDAVYDLGGERRREREDK